MISKTKLNRESKLSEVHTFIKDNWEVGCKCPACGRVAKLYRRRLNSSMAYALIIIYKLHRKNGMQKYFKMNQEIASLKIPASNIEYAKLRYWGLLEQPINPKTKKPINGMWRITKKGIEFVLDEITVPLYSMVYNTQVKGYGEEHINIIIALNQKFSYNVLMKGLI